MQVTELRRRLVDRVAKVATEPDEEATAIALTHVRAILVALAGRPDDDEVSLDGLTVGTQTAALIMGLHREYVRTLVRGGQLSATKTNGEFQIPLSDVADHTLTPLGRQELLLRKEGKSRPLDKGWIEIPEVQFIHDHEEESG